MLTIENVRDEFASLLEINQFNEDKTGVKTLEILGEAISTGADLLLGDEYIFGELNESYAKDEVNWYKSCSRNVWDLKKTPKIWEAVSDKDGNINSNYGWCIYSKDNGTQYINTLRELKRNKSSRRASMIYTRPSMHTEYNTNGMSDFMCTWGVDYEIRYNKLYAIVKMRSNDVVFGFKNDRYWQEYVFDQLLTDLRNTVYPQLEKGDIIWNASSLHIYEQQFHLVYHYLKSGKQTITKAEFRKTYPKIIRDGYLDDGNIKFKL
jgi:thymidylate synthase